MQHDVAGESDQRMQLPTWRPVFCGWWLLALAGMLAGVAPVFSQTTSQTSFGKNRVQFNRQIDEWMLYETANFITYWYGDARNVAQSALQMAEYDFPSLQQMLEHQMTDKIEMLVFSDLTDLKQSNIGEDEVFQLRAGETKVVGNKVFVYFDGDHTHLRAQIREGVAGVLINSMLFGLSYDLNLGALQANQRQGAFELSVSYLGNYDNEKILCPKF